MIQVVFILPDSSLLFSEFLVMFASEISDPRHPPNADSLSLLVSDPRAPASEYRDWLRRMSGRCDPGAYALMFKYVLYRPVPSSQGCIFTFVS